MVPISFLVSSSDVRKITHPSINQFPRREPIKYGVKMN
jgi:hypothetical protein